MARPIGDIIPEVLERAIRISALSEFIATFDDAADRKNIVMRLYHADIITSQTAELMVEHFGLEAA